MEIKLINIGFGNIVSANRIIAIVSPESAPIKRIITEARDRGMLVDATYGRRTRAVIITDSDHVILSAVQPETVAHRLVIRIVLSVTMKSNARGNLIVVSGPSGSGKGTVCQGLFKELANLQLSISATSRKPRGEERHGVDYYFLTREQFESMIAGSQLLEWADVYGNYYGTPQQPVLDALNQGMDVVLEIDVQGALQVKSKYPDGVLIFLIPPSRAELAERLKNRGTDSSEAIEERLKWAEKEIKEIVKYDYLVINEDLTDAVQRVCAIITAERCRPRLFEMDLLLQNY
jgi:guanylate kinase